MASSPANGTDRDQATGHASLDQLLGHTDRAGRMASRLRQTAEWVGLGTATSRLLGNVFLAGMARRVHAIPDDHDPAYLHTARTALILLADARVHDQDTLLASVLRDSERPDLELDPVAVTELAGAGTAAILRALPPRDLPRAELLERLVTLPTATLTLHVAERLDHMRHLHLGPRERWAAGYRETMDLLTPLADRCHPMLARRLERWAGAFQRRFIDSEA